MNLNTVTIKGNLTDSPKLDRTPHQQVPVLEAVVLVNRRVKVGDDQWEDAEPTRYRIKAWRQLAENIASLPKGAEVLVIGHVETEAYSVDGQKRTSDILVVEALGASLAHATVTITKNNSAENLGVA